MEPNPGLGRKEKAVYSRRTFLGSSSLGLAALGIGCVQQPNERQPASRPDFDSETTNFWMFNSVTTRGGLPDALSDQSLHARFVFTPDASAVSPGMTVAAFVQQSVSSIPEFLFWNELETRLEFPGDVSTESMPDDGDMEVTVTAQRFRLSEQDRRTFKDVETASLRLDLEQSRPMPGLPEAIAASAVAAILPDQRGEFPHLQELTFDPGQAFGSPYTIRLPDGEGAISWNFFLKKKAGFFGKLVEWVRTASSIATPLVPLLGLPAVSLTALTRTKQILGYLQAQDESTWLYQDVRLRAFATKKAESEMRVPDPLPLKTGDYLVVPRAHVVHLQGHNPHLFRGVLLPGKMTPEEKHSASGKRGRTTYLK